MCYRFGRLLVAIYKCVNMNVYFGGFIMIVLIFLLIVIHNCYSHPTIVDVISGKVVIVCQRTVMYCLHTPVVTIWSMRVVRDTKVRSVRLKFARPTKNNNNYFSALRYG